MRKVIDHAAHEAGIKPPLLDFHTGQVSTSSSAVSFLSHFPYADSAWNGEGFAPIFAGDADGWLINFSGFQHGIAADMLGGGSENGGSGDKGMLYKAMLFGASRRNGEHTPALWAQVWDEQKLGGSNMIGWWEDDPAATATLVAAPPPPPPTPVPTPSADWKAYPQKSFSGPNVTPCNCHVPSVVASSQCECELCCPVQGEGLLNISLAVCEAACLGQGAATKHTAGKSCTAVNYSPRDSASPSGCVFRAMGDGRTGAPATQPWPSGTGYSFQGTAEQSAPDPWPRQEHSAALVTTFSIHQERAVFVVASWASQPARITLEIDWEGLGLSPGSGLKVEAPAVVGWQAAAELGNGTVAPAFELPAKGGLFVVASRA